MITFKCPGCGARLETSDSLAGQEDTCPQCGKQCRVPSQQSASGVGAGAVAKRLFLSYCVGATRFWRWAGHGLHTAAKRIASTQIGKARKPVNPVAIAGESEPSGVTPGSNRKQCPKCKEWIDKSATKCPHCRSSQPTPAWATVVAAVIVIGLGVWGFRSCSSIFSLSPETKARIEAERQQEDRYGSKSMAWVMAQDFVKKQLVSPGSADFGGMFDQSYEDCVTDLGDGRYSVRGWVDSQNRFGAKLRSNFSCTLKYMGNDRWRCESIDVTER